MRLIIDEYTKEKYVTTKQIHSERDREKERVGERYTGKTKELRASEREEPHNLNYNLEAKKEHKIVMNPYAQLKCHFQFCVYIMKGESASTTVNNNNNNQMMVFKKY